MSERPKVLFIMQMPPPVHGAAMMGKSIRESALINETFECRYINESFSKTVDDVGKFRLSKLAYLFRHVRDIRRAVKEFQPDLVYMTPGGGNPGPELFRYVLELSAIRVFHRPEILHFHNKSSREKTHQWYIRWYYRWLFNRTDVILLSHLLEHQYEGYLKPEHIHICPNGIPEPCLDVVSAEKANAVPRLLFLSNLIISKGVLTLLSAARLLSDRGYEFKCDFIGAETQDMDEGSFLKETEKRGLNHCVKYHGKKFGKEKEAFFRQADIFVFPTFYPGESFPLVILEAMAYGLPVISTREGGIPDMVENGKNGYLCRQDDPEDLARHIAVLLDDPQSRQQMGRQSREMYLGRFTLDHFEKRLCEIIKECLI